MSYSTLFFTDFILQNRSAQDLPLEGAKARLEELKESLYQREREITDLLGSDRNLVPLFPQPSCSLILNSVVQKVLTFLTF